MNGKTIFNILPFRKVAQKSSIVRSTVSVIEWDTFEEKQYEMVAHL